MLVMRTSVGIYLLVFGLLVSPAVAQSAAQHLVKSFLGNCVLNLPNLDKIRAGAKVFDWKPLSQEMNEVLGPVDPTAESEGWIVDEQDLRFFVAISEGVIDGEKWANCAIAARVSRPDFVALLESKLDLSNLYDETEAGQRYQTWTTSVNGYSMLIALTAAQDDARPEVTIAASMKAR